MRTLYLECYSGISGDMTVGALLDLGADREALMKALDSLGVGGYRLRFGRKKKNGIDAFDFDVLLDGEMSGRHVHGDHDHDGHIHGDHVHGESGHVHRNLGDVYEVIDRLDACDSVKAMARKIFFIVAEAEAKSHGIPVERVHFHEVGAIDSIIDIIGTAVCLDNLGVDKVIVSPLAEGRGYVRCQHGVIPVPVPATANIAASYGLRLKMTENNGEMVTPTGAAIAAALDSGEELPENYRIVKIGVGAGNKDFENANILRAMLIETAEESGGDEMWVLESNIDDCGGEALGFTMERLLEAGAADVWYTPIYMKKNRPSYQLQVLTPKDEIEVMEALIFRHTTTIGIRRHPVTRTVMDRKTEIVDTVYGEAKVKVCSYRGSTFFYPEYESVRQILVENGGDADFEKVYQAIALEAKRLHGGGE